MNNLQELRKEIDAIKARNRRVELDKAWENSLPRKVTIITLTYAVMVVVMMSLRVEQPFLSAIVPAVAYFLSTLSLPIIKNWWMEKKKD